MDVNGSNFEAHWPTLARHISRSTFVAIDLELSGIPTKQTDQLKARDQRPGRRQTVQERYEANKSAAERYSIVQIGLTFVEEDPIRGVYIARPYNFHVNPILDPKFGIERDICFSSGSSEFLLRHGFDMDSLFTAGIPYLSRLEETAIRKSLGLAIHPGEMTTFGGDFGRQEYESIGIFLQSTSQAIKSWKSRNSPSSEYLEIGPSRGHSLWKTRGSLTPYEVQIVHQIVRSQHPDLVAETWPGVVRVLRRDATDDTASVEHSPEQLKADLVYAKGLRWIFEALCPQVDEVLSMNLKEPYATGNLSQTMAWTAPYLRVSGTFPKHISGDLASLMDDIRQHETVLIGHNMFMDLIYLYQAFWGPLPDTVEEFTGIIEAIFPMVFDTKYLADARFRYSKENVSSSLHDLDRLFSKTTNPVIEIPPAFDKYDSSDMAHEAGFDSLVTARVFLRMICELSPSRHVFVPVDSNTNAGENTHETRESDPRTNLSEDLLMTVPETNPDVPHSGPTSASQSKRNSSRGIWRVLMPSQGSEVWEAFGWKLRVNGTVEGFCRI